MNQEEINNKIFERLDKIEKIIFSHESTAAIVKKQKRKNKLENLEAPIAKIFNAGFFKESKNDKEVLSELKRKILTKQKPLRSSVVNVLRRMVKKELLERTEIIMNKRKVIGYKSL